MSIAIREIETPNGESLPGFDKLAQHAELMSDFQTHMQVATGEAVERAFVYAEKLSKDVLIRVKEELAGYARPKQQIMVVEMDKVQRKLSFPATEYLPRLLINAQIGENTMLVGPAGCGKTTAATQVAEALGLAFGHICLTAGASEAWLFGRQTPNGFIEAKFSELYRTGGVFLLDEMDAADPNLLMAINTALDNGHMANPINGELIKKHEKFVCIAAANTVGKGSDGTYTARNRLDAATLNRFTLLAVDYSDSIEESVCPDKELRERLQNARVKLKEMKSQEMITTRDLRRAYQFQKAGVGMFDIMASLTLGWPQEIVKQIGLDEKTPKGKGKGKVSPPMGQKQAEEEAIF